MSENVAISIVMPMLFACVAYILKSVMDTLRRSRSERLQAELYGKLFEKFGSSADLVAYLQSEAGQNFLKAAPVERTGPFNRILNSMQAGIVLFFMGIACLLLRLGVGSDAQEPMLVLGSVGSALGLGLLVSGGASWFLARNWGLLNGKP